MAIVLIGFMGAGKTTIGQALAGRLNKRFVDLDTYIEQREGRTIATIFSADGEDYFRQLEHEALRTWLPEDIIMATGGGIVEREENIHILNQNADTFWLNTDIEKLFVRISGDLSRPNAAEHTFSQIKELYNKRLSRYNEIAFMEVDSNKTVEECVELILTHLSHS
ncbi:shikimate kinase [Macrococcus carouselicus]|uniref:Shikimate kinase n=1 Tax=Macrococcus carouselicus TaxID=69969 RepID=A0A9Q8CKF4_9STAP|nr:shikimate kinase [Macrococcus carouselicus]TDM04338.1 shikimate kinase [Macrococcus carouselicus]